MAKMVADLVEATILDKDDLLYVVRGTSTTSGKKMKGSQFLMEVLTASGNTGIDLSSKTSDLLVEMTGADAGPKTFVCTAAEYLPLGRRFIFANNGSGTTVYTLTLPDLTTHTVNPGDTITIICLAAGIIVEKNILGNALTATRLQTARTINGTSFDGSANITVTAAAGTLTGATLASNVTASYLTSVGILTAVQVDNVNIDGNTIASTSGDLNINPFAGSKILLDATISVDAGVITGATSITSTTFLGDLNGTINTATTAATQSQGDNSTKVATTAYVDAAVLTEDFWTRTSTTVTLKTSGDTLNLSGDFQVATSKFTVAALTGNTAIYGDLAVATNKFTVASATGNTVVAGTFHGAGDFDIATNLFQIAAATGNTLIAGTLGVTGAITGNLTGNCSGTAATVTGAAQTSITSLGTLTALQVDNVNINGDTISNTTGILYLTPYTGNAVVIDGYFSFDGTILTGITDSNMTITAPTGRNIGIEGVTFDGGVVGGISSLGVTGTRVTAGFFTDLTITNAISGSITGNAATATKLATARAINGVDFDGSAAITVTAAGSTLTGTSLNSTIVSSSLTSVGTLSSLAMGGNIALGSNYLSGDGGNEGLQIDASGNATFSGVINGTSASLSSSIACTTISSYFSLNLTNTMARPISIKHITSGTQTDGFGVGISYATQTGAGDPNIVGYLGFVRAGADGTSDLVGLPSTTGTPTERFRVSSAGVLSSITSIGVTGARIANAFFTDLAVTNAIAGSITGTAAKATNLVGGNSTTLLGSIGYQSNTDTTTMLVPNTTSTKKFLRMTGTGTNGAVPVWDTIVDADIPNLTGKTYNGLTLTAASVGFTIAGGTTSKTLTINNTLALSGTDSTVITLPATTGTVALNNQTFYLGSTSIAINRASASIALTGITSIDGSSASCTGNAATVTTNANLTGVVTSTGNTTAIASGAIKANMLQSAASDLGAANVTIDLSNTNGAYVTNVTIDGTYTGTFSGNLTGNVTGNCSGTAATVTGAAQASITSVGTLSTLTVSGAIASSNGLSTFTYTTIDGNTPLTVTNAGVIAGRFIGAATDTTVANGSGVRLALRNSNGTNNNYSQIQFEESNGSPSALITCKHLVHSATVPESELYFFTRNGASLTQAMKLDKVGAVTITGAITGATTTNTINGVIINSGAVSGVSTLTTTSNVTISTVANGLTIGTVTTASDAAVQIGATLANGFHYLDYCVADAYSAQYAIRKSRGTAASPASVSSGDVLGTYGFYAHDGTNWYKTAQIRATISATTGTTDLPTKLDFYTTPDGSATAAIALTLGADKSATFYGAASGVTSFAASGRITTTDTTEATTTSDGSIATAGGISCVKAIYAGGDLTVLGSNVTLAPGGVTFKCDEAGSEPGSQFIFRVDNATRLSMGSGAATFTIPVITTQYKLSALNTAPANAGATGTLGEIRVVADAIYVCTATNTWVKAALATWS